MANEISITINNSLVNGELKDQPQARSFKQDQTVRAMHKVTSLVPAADTLASLGGITAPGWMIIQNLDAVNFVTLGPEATGALVPYQKVEPGATHALRLDPAVVLRWEADTAAVEVLLTVYED